MSVVAVLAWPGYCHAVIVMLLLLCCGIDSAFGLSFFFLFPEERLVGSLVAFFYPLSRLPWCKINKKNVPGLLFAWRRRDLQLHYQVELLWSSVIAAAFLWVEGGTALLTGRCFTDGLVFHCRGRITEGSGIWLIGMFHGRDGIR